MMVPKIINNGTKNPYLPILAKVTFVTQETLGERSIKTYRMEFNDDVTRREFDYKPGQLCMVSVFGRGESMISISSSPSRKEFLEFSVMRLGRVTEAIHQLEVGDELGLRGPYGNGFPVEQWVGKNIFFIGGGIGMAPIRSVMNYVLDNRDRFGKLMLIYGARSSKDLAFKSEIEKLEKNDVIDVRLSIDIDEPGWLRINRQNPENTVYDPLCRKFSGFVAELVMAMKCSPKNAIAVTCGPVIMIKTVIASLKKLGWEDGNIYTTLENKMKCGIGKCGRCNIGDVYVCTDGPVFSYAQIRKMPADL